MEQIKRIDIMTDIETLGNKSDSTIIQIAAIAFDIETGEELSQFNQIADIEKNKEMKVTGDTLKWWLNTDKELLTALLNKGVYSSEEILFNFHNWIIATTLNYPHLTDRDVYLWGNGMLFDNKMIEHQFNEIGLKYPIFYRNDRDMRTLVDLAAKKLGMTDMELREKFDDPTLTHHDAFDDVRYQINLTVSCYQELTKAAVAKPFL